MESWIRFASEKIVIRYWYCDYSDLREDKCWIREFRENSVSIPRWFNASGSAVEKTFANKLSNRIAVILIEIGGSGSLDLTLARRIDVLH